jgi:hypothetical protein
MGWIAGSLGGTHCGIGSAAVGRACRRVSGKNAKAAEAVFARADEREFS